MIYIFLSILGATLIFVIFKWFSVKRIDTFQAIVVNYFVAAFCGIIISGNIPDIKLESAWFPYSIAIGFMFITIFTVMALTTQKVGVSAAAVASKMSVVVPVIAAAFLYGDTFGTIKIIGIFVALIAVYLTTRKDRTNKNSKLISSGELILLPIILFIGTGLIDTSIKFVQHFKLQEGERETFISSLFLTAAIAGTLLMVIRNISVKNKFKASSLLGGLVLGIPNYFSLFFLMKALEAPGIESSVIFPIINVGIVALSALVAVLIFKERPSRINFIGIILSFIAIIIITYSSGL